MSGTTGNPKDELGFRVLEAIRGDQVKINGDEYDVLMSTRLRAKSDDGNPTHADLYGYYVIDDSGQEYRVTVKPDLSDSDEHIDEIEIATMGLLSATHIDEITAFEFIDQVDGDRVPRDRYIEIWEDERQEKRQ